MHASDMAEEYPVVSQESAAIDAARLIAEHRLPGLVVTDAGGTPRTILPSSQVVRFLVPGYVLDDPSLARVLDESMADRAAEELEGRTVGDLVPENPAELAVLEADDTIVEVATLMARLRSPLAAVVEDGHVVGVVTASRLLQLALGASER